MSDEKSYYAKGNISVTSTRVVLGGKTYALSNITSVALGKKTGSILPPFGLIAVGAIIAAIVGGSFGNFIAIAAIVGGFVWLVYVIAKPYYVVKIGSASGETDVFHSKNQAEIQEIVNAIIERG